MVDTARNHSQFDTHPNLRQATFEGSIKLPISLSNNNPRGTEWQEQLFRLVKEAAR